MRCVWLFAAGMVLQLFTGGLDVSFLSYPWSIVLAFGYLCLLVFLHVYTGRWKWVRRLYDREACVISLASMLIMTLFFGLIRQGGATEGLFAWLGFTNMTSCWSFNLLLFHFMSVLGLKTMEDIHGWKRRNISTVVLHTAFFVILVSAVFGSGDKLKVRVIAEVGKPVQMGFTTEGKRVSLPFMLTLSEFTMNEYSPRIHIVDEGILSNQFVEIERKGSCGTLGDWKLVCSDYIEKAGRIHQDSVYIPMQQVGTMPAAYLKAFHTETHDSVEGWVSCGSYIFSGNTLTLPDGSLLVMPQRKVKKYLSKVLVETEEDNQLMEIEVNRPAKVGYWKIYQSDYDRSRGCWSTTSVLEGVRDAWYTPVHIALWAILIAGLCMILYRRYSYQWILGFSAFFALVFVLINLFKPEIHSKALMPALQSVWFVPHVIVYMFAYAMLGVTTLFVLCLWLRKAQKKAADRELAICDKLVRIGWAFLCLGMTMGALWAKDAWGDYWTWDPKETWAFATWICYLLYLHLRPSCKNQAFLFAWLVFSFILLQMCWWGINFLPSAQGLSIHTY